MEELLRSLVYPVIIAAVASGLSYIASRRIQSADVATKFQALASKQADDNEKLEAEIDKLKLALTTKDNEIAILKARVTELESENATLKSEIEALQRRRK